MSKHPVLAALVLTLLGDCSGQFAKALEPEPGAVFVRLVDTGAGLCCVIKTDNDTAIVYDTGHWNASGFRALQGVKDLFPTTHPVTLMVLSHSDSDHLGGATRILEEYAVQEVVHSGLEPVSQTSINTLRAISNEPDCDDINLHYYDFPEGTFTYGDTKVTFLCGWHTPPEDWPLTSDGERFNAGSICIRVEFAGKSILLCGDAVGRHLNSPAGTNIATEKYLCDRADEFPIASDVIVAPHHGANNGSSERFIELVDPDWVVFSAGHDHQHPTAAAAERYLSSGVPISQMLRTDRGDDEPGGFEWDEGSEPGHVDPPGDDDVDLLVRPNGELLVDYRYVDFLDSPSEVRAEIIDGVEVLEVVRAHPSRNVPAWVLEAESKSPEEIEALDRVPAREGASRTYAGSPSSSLKCHERRCARPGLLRRLFGCRARCR